MNHNEKRSSTEEGITRRRLEKKTVNRHTGTRDLE
jgi:hypothetical protein